MPITEHQRQARRTKLGSSDAPAIVGVSPWLTAQQVYWSKKVEQPDNGTKSMQTGNRMEKPLVEFVEEELGVKAVRNQYRVSKGSDGGILAANIDALITDRPEGIECKYVGQQAAGDWGQAGTDEVPEHVIVQVQHQMHCANLERVWVAAAVAGYSLDWRLYCVQRHDVLIKAIVRQEVLFWTEHVQRDEPPEPGPPPMEVLAALRREPDSLVYLDNSGVAAKNAFEHLRQNRLDSQKAEERARADLLAMLGEAEGGRLETGETITYLSQRSPARLDIKRLRADHPDIYNEYVTQGTHRVLRIKKPKELTHERGHETGDNPGGGNRLGAPRAPA